MKRKNLWFILATLALVLAGCGNLKSTGSTGTQTSTNNKGVQTTGATGESNYTGVIENGHYKTSAARGLTTSQTDNVLNVKSMEDGLTDLSKSQFPTDKYLLQEGQYLKSDTIKDWLARKSQKNPEGLNPADNGSTDADKRAPLYLQQILEQDYVTQTDDKSVKLGGISIALGMNSVDYYQKEEYGAEFQTNISDNTLLAQGKQMAQTIVQRLRQRKGLENVPITIGIYKQASKDSLVGGTYVSATTVDNGAKKIDSWKRVNEKNQVLPTASGEKAVNSGDNDSFSNFKTQVQSFFPNLAGVVAQAHYENDQLAGMNITINTQFYGETEITSFTQYIAQAAGRYLPRNIPLQITIQSTQGIQAFVARSSNAKSFYTHVFSSY
ncbi:CamS family sex pheromone protein [Lactobacillus sp. CC-MHH1034]|uniref:CamS family sex pheromone protein n=1 Tax=Agrilactobacillus fermenti TaxID=2586909 RepID=UPI001E3AEE25|nr:CamS family sex pheromone protein [Agrilactobacillus fermenti]MCD2255145.1 CamS family sex pheromone protein [Agrilactobacillus fermenti]